MQIHNRANIWTEEIVRCCAQHQKSLNRYLLIEEFIVSKKIYR